MKTRNCEVMDSTRVSGYLWPKSGCIVSLSCTQNAVPVDFFVNYAPVPHLYLWEQDKSSSLVRLSSAYR